MASSAESPLPRSVLCHGEVQTSSTIFRKKREYLVLTETHLVRFRNQQKAAESFSCISLPAQRTLTKRHSHTPSVGSLELAFTGSENFLDSEAGTPLKHVVAVHQLDDGRPYFALEVAFLDPESNQSFTLTLQFGEPEDMRLWLKTIRAAANDIRRSEPNQISKHNLDRAATFIDHEADSRPQDLAVYKVVQRPLSRAGARASSDDLSKIAATICFLSVGAYKLHLIPLNKLSHRSSTPSLGSCANQSSYGIMTLVGLRVSETDDTFELTFRSPLQKPITIHLASLASHEIVLRLRFAEVSLRPGWETRPYVFIVPEEVKGEIHRNSSPHPPNQDSFHDTLTAYCMAYEVNPTEIFYNITEPEQGVHRFELYPHTAGRAYTINELLSVLRALRYNEVFREISFANVSLDELNGLYDHWGHEHVCYKTKRGTPAGTLEDFMAASLLIQEVRALAMTNRKLKLLDFTSCISRKASGFTDGTKSTDIGCGITEALFPLCKIQKTNVEWIYLNRIHLGETDLDWIVDAIVDKMCHFRGLELRDCGLTDRGLGLILDALEGQEDTLEALDISENPFRLSPTMFDFHISRFAYLRILKLANIGRVSNSEPLISSETLKCWRLQELDLSGTLVNPATLNAITEYLQDEKKSSSLHELHIAHTSLTGRELGSLMRSIPKSQNNQRFLLIDISQNNIETGLDELTEAILAGHGPTYLIMKLIEFEDETSFQRIIRAFTENQTIRYLDISRLSLPCDASDETCRALENLFARNSTLEWLDISGEDSRLETSKLGVGINRALCGLKHNTTLKYIDIQYQRLGLQGASTLADVLKDNKGLTEVHCENNNVPLSGFTDLINSLKYNTTLRWLPSLEDGRRAHLKRTEAEIRELQEKVHTPTSQRPSVRSKLGSIVGKSHKERAPTWQLTPNDIMAALKLVDESWDRQAHRLSQYLQRNIDIYNGNPMVVGIDDEDFERGSEDGSVEKIIDKVKLDTTPTLEKQLDFGTGVDELLKFEFEHRMDRCLDLRD